MKRFVVLAAALVAGCSEPEPLRVEGAWLRLPAVAGRPGAAYGVIRGGPEPATLISAASDWAVRVELHETVRRGGVSAMERMRSVAIPANGAVEFRPGGRHLMVYGINPAVRVGDTMTFTFYFADGRRVRRIAQVVGPGDPAPE